VALKGIQPPNVCLATVKLCVFLSAISHKVINPLEIANLHNDMVQCLVSFELVFPPSFFNIMGVLKKYIHNCAWPEGSITKGSRIEEVIKFYVDFIPDLDPIGIPESRHEGRLSEKGTPGKKTYIGMEDDYFNKAHYTVLQNSSVVDPYIEAHMDLLQSKFPGKTEAWITC
jgi:hypothetical protein